MPQLESAAEEAEAQMLFELAKKHLFDVAQNALNPAAPSQLQQHGVRVVKGALKSYTKNKGNLPGYMEELVKAFIAPPTVPWTELFAAFVQKVLMSKPTRGMRRISKRRAAIAQQLKRRGQGALAKRIPLFPGYERDHKFFIVFVVDTSGSMTASDMQAGLSELQHLQRSGMDLRVLVLYIDTHVGKEYEIGPDDEIDPKMCGRGGTEFETAFAHVDKLMKGGQHVDLLVYATDGYATPPKTKLPIPAVWLITAGGQPIMKGQPGHVTFQMRDYEAGANPDA